MYGIAIIVTNQVILHLIVDLTKLIKLDIFRIFLKIKIHLKIKISHKIQIPHKIEISHKIKTFLQIRTSLILKEIIQIIIKILILRNFVVIVKIQDM